MSEVKQHPFLAPGVAGATLTVDLGALRQNFLTLKGMCGSAECAAAVKGDAYGTGVSEVVRTLNGAGCNTFFVAQLSEAVQVRTVLEEAVIYVLNGLVFAEASSYAELQLRPVLATLEEIDEWAKFCRAGDTRLPAAIHVDTGINRLGLTPPEVDRLANTPEITAAFDLTLVMSHLACADEPDHPMNAAQVERFDALRAKLPDAPASLANSGGVLNGSAYHYDLVRPGVRRSNDGANPIAGRNNPMQKVVAVESSVLQVREVPAGQHGRLWRHLAGKQTVADCGRAGGIL